MSRTTRRNKRHLILDTLGDFPRFVNDIFGWPRSAVLMLMSYSALYGKIWIPCSIAILAALFVPFDPQLQVWVVGLTITYLAQRAVSTFIIKGLNTP
jgi:hypothetical protein